MTRKNAAWLLVLVALEVMSALGVVWLRHQSRITYTELQAVQARIDIELDMWSRLQLQGATQAAAQRVEEIARRDLGMHEPVQPKVLLLQDTTGVR